ncbi:WD40 repeat-like protein [Penicillium malachiteum]|uniref:WD40 repeat-like protein n=1 Tax=Penicillium malachiteum TaxID=1324776 RepID=UPI002549016D|nr:WD40 repeat-like protein [Penicillium malachiteum]KAJ5729858.1 WD40 repeat-like protein [Penicillium malachiteum]
MNPFTGWSAIFAQFTKEWRYHEKRRYAFQSRFFSDDTPLDELQINFENNDSVQAVDSMENLTFNFEKDSDLWGMAYCKLRIQESDLITGYEKIMHEYLHNTQDQGVRDLDVPSIQQSQLVEFLRCSLENVTSMQSTVGKMGPHVRQAQSAMLSLKSGITLAVPHGAILWASLAVALSMASLFSSAVHDVANAINGVADITGKMKWYTNLADVLVHHQHRQEEPFLAMRCELLSKILDMYTTLLHFAIECVCAFRQGLSQALTQLQISPSKWESLRQSIYIAEQEVEDLLSQYSNASITSYVSLLVHLELSKEYRDIMQQLCVIDVDAAIKSLRKQSENNETYPEEAQNLASRECNDRHLCLPNGEDEATTTQMIRAFDFLIKQLNTRFDISHVSYFFVTTRKKKPML